MDMIFYYYITEIILMILTSLTEEHLAFTVTFDLEKEQNESLNSATTKLLDTLGGVADTKKTLDSGSSAVSQLTWQTY